MSNKKSESLTTFKFDQAAKDELAAIVSEGGGSSSKEVQSAVANHGLGWVEEGQPRDEVAITWDGNLEGKEESAALKYLLDLPDTTKMIKVSADTYEDYDTSTAIAYLSWISSYQSDYFEGNEILEISNKEVLDTYTDVYYSSDNFGYIICTQDHEIDTGETILLLEKGIYFPYSWQEHEGFIDTEFTSKLLFKAGIHDQEEVTIIWNDDTIVRSTDLEFIYNEIYRYNYRYIYKIAEFNLDFKPYDWLNKNGIILQKQSGEIIDSRQYTVDRIEHGYMSPVSEMQAIYIVTAADPVAIVVIEDVSFTDPNDPSHIFSIPSGVYFLLEEDTDSDIITYTSELTLQEEQHLPEVIHKIDDKFLDGNTGDTFTIQALLDYDTNNYIMNKTWKEIHAAYQAGKSVYVQLIDFRNSEGAWVTQAFLANYDLDRFRGHYNVHYPLIANNELKYNVLDFEYSSDNDYPIAYSSY